MQNKLIADVPARIWEDGRPTGLHIWDAEFNVAAWVRVSGTNGEIRLLLCHEDDAGQHGCIVDSCAVSGESNSLVSGLISVRFTGKVKKVQMILKLSDPEIRTHVDELFVQRKGREMRRENKLISKS
jgi:hypothetical protein